MISFPFANLRHRNAIACALLWSFCTAPAYTKWAGLSTQDVPVNRLLANIQATASRLPATTTNKDRAQIEFELGRLHSLAYANKSEVAPGTRSSQPNEPEHPAYGHVPDHKQFEVEQTNDPAKIKLAKDHLAQAVDHLGKAVRLDPSLTAAKMGLAWCLDQSGKKDQALKLYREVFKSAWEKEKNSSGMRGFSLTHECGQYLQALLNPKTDANEIDDVKEKMAKSDQRYCAVTPIVIPLSTQITVDTLIQKKPVTFNLDGHGARECRSWLGPDAGWLVYDGDGEGRIDSGRQLIGGVSFWIFWKNGYDVLSALDDNHDGKLTGKELVHLSIWQDANSDGVAQQSEVQPLARWHINELSCAYDEKRKDLLESGKGVTFEDGSSRPTYDVWIEEEPKKRR